MSSPEKYFRIEAQDPTPNFIGIFKTLAPTLSSELYQVAVAPGTESRIGYFNDVAVGVLVAELLTTGKVAIHNLSVLPAYKGLGLEDELVRHLKVKECQVSVEGLAQQLAEINLNVAISPNTS
ncbi:MAG: hypothetical protein SGCHY_002001 [Lobulomycetales sp.]